MHLVAVELCHRPIHACVHEYGRAAEAFSSQLAVKFSSFYACCVRCHRSLECRHTGCSSASELDTSDLKQLTDAVSSLSIASVLTSASNSLSPSDRDDSVYCVTSHDNAANSTTSAAARENVLNRSNAFRVVAAATQPPPPPPTNGLVSTQQPDVRYRSTVSCQLCRNLRDKCTVRLLPTVAEQAIWMPNSGSGGRASDAHSPVSADHQLVDVSTHLSNLAGDGAGRTGSLSDQSSSSSSSEM